MSKYTEAELVSLIMANGGSREFKEQLIECVRDSKENAVLRDLLNSKQDLIDRLEAPRYLGGEPGNHKRRKGGGGGI